MTEPKVVRYALKSLAALRQDDENGGWVRYADYARLAARVEELEYNLEQCRKGSVIRTQIDKRRYDEIKRLREAATHAETVMRYLEEDGVSIVPHLLDDDENPGQRLREALAALREKP